MRQEGEGMNKKQLAQAGILAAMITGLLVYLIFFHGWLLIMGMCVSGIFACIFFLVALVLTKGAIIPNPYPHYCVALKGRKEDE
nr:MAG TPA: hypothetical protein [Caudoviricetes sp.]